MNLSLGLTPDPAAARCFGAAMDAGAQDAAANGAAAAEGAAAAGVAAAAAAAAASSLLRGPSATAQLRRNIKREAFTPDLSIGQTSCLVTRKGWVNISPRIPTYPAFPIGQRCVLKAYPDL